MFFLLVIIGVKMREKHKPNRDSKPKTHRTLFTRALGGLIDLLPSREKRKLDEKRDEKHHELLRLIGKCSTDTDEIKKAAMLLRDDEYLRVCAELLEYSDESKLREWSTRRNASKIIRGMRSVWLVDWYCNDRTAKPVSVEPIAQAIWNVLGRTEDAEITSNLMTALREEIRSRATIPIDYDVLIKLLMKYRGDKKLNEAEKIVLIEALKIGRPGAILIAGMTVGATNTEFEILADIVDFMFHNGYDIGPLIPEIGSTVEMMGVRARSFSEILDLYAKRSTWDACVIIGDYGGR